MKKPHTVWFLALAALICVPAAASAEIAVGEAAPEFTLTDIENKEVSLSDFRGSVIVLEWMNPDCPFVKKHYESKNMQTLQREYGEKEVVWLTINSSAPTKQGHYSIDDWQRIAADYLIESKAVLLDPSGETGRAYGAKTTPHLFVIDGQGLVVYKGAIDDQPSTDAADIAGAKNYVKAALDETLEGKPVTTASTESYGCSVKY